MQLFHFLLGSARTCLPKLLYVLHHLLSSFSASSITEPLMQGEDMRDYLSKNINPTLIKGLTELCKQKPEDPIVSMARKNMT